MDLERAEDTQNLSERRYVRADGSVIAGTYRGGRATRHLRRRRERLVRLSGHLQTGFEALMRAVIALSRARIWTPVAFAVCIGAGLFSLSSGLAMRIFGFYLGLSSALLFLGACFWVIATLIIGKFWIEALAGSSDGPNHP